MALPDCGRQDQVQIRRVDIAIAQHGVLRQDSELAVTLVLPVPPLPLMMTISFMPPPRKSWSKAGKKRRIVRHGVYKRGSFCVGFRDPPVIRDFRQQRYLFHLQVRAN